ncbi:Tat-translocated enzyme [Advenella kashmirensis W13003]|uniref:Deferrochelatase n=1 Tax=Advenella kashmirensis W13003 TaxID=1424334 RepID=V8QSL3_9BURK|nr:iron uptake transporter deferrochelatase/peroxidase subunit [Advenella kashmirensis]ETF02951.1 Tat-translocated enzyme [Advenella kashmirensis W13003]
MATKNHLTHNVNETEPTSRARRRVLGGLGAAGAALTGLSIANAQTAARSDNAQAADAPQITHTEDRVPYLGQHQAGVVTPHPVAGMVVSFGVLAQNRDELEQMFRTLTQRIAFLTQGGTPPALDPKLPPADSGILGPVVRPAGLTITVSVGASLFDERFGLAAHKPRHLQAMTGFPNDALDASLCHGDLSIQFCANTGDVILYALRDIIKTMPGFLLVNWKQEGIVPPVKPVAGKRPGTARNYLGFHDGSANPNSSDAEQMDKIVWVQADSGEPGWAIGGSYQVVRIIRNFVERWDRTPLQEQEVIFGRVKATGAPLDGGSSEFDVPNYEKDPKGQLTSFDSHIRRANPRTAESQANLILRRPFNYSNGVTKSGQLDMGLLFICYQADLQKGFITVQKRLDGEPLEEYIKPVGGGYFFTLPGVRDEQDWLGRALLEKSRVS